MIKTKNISTQKNEKKRKLSLTTRAMYEHHKSGKNLAVASTRRRLLEADVGNCNIDATGG
jgi:hypothetical protein